MLLSPEVNKGREKERKIQGNFFRVFFFVLLLDVCVGREKEKASKRNAFLCFSLLRTYVGGKYIRLRGKKSFSLSRNSKERVRVREREGKKSFSVFSFLFLREFGQNSSFPFSTFSAVFCLLFSVKKQIFLFSFVFERLSFFQGQLYFSFFY